MKLLIAAITFAATLGMLFLIETGKSPKEDSARIIEALKEENANAAVSVTPSIIKARTPTPTPTLTPDHTLTPTPTSTQTPTKTLSPTPPPTSSSSSPAPSITPTPTSTLSSPLQEAGQGFINILSITSPRKRGLTAELSIATLPDAQCLIKVTLPSGSESGASGLKTPITDAPGNIRWSWKIGGSTTPGTATIDLNCSKDSQSFSKSLQMVITE